MALYSPEHMTVQGNIPTQRNLSVFTIVALRGHRVIKTAWGSLPILRAEMPEYGTLPPTLTHYCSEEYPKEVTFHCVNNHDLWVRASPNPDMPIGEIQPPKVVLRRRA